MADDLVFFFDFASPYAYFAFDEVLDLAHQSGRKVTLRPAMVWAILKAQGIAEPLASSARRAYLLSDMARSAAFHNLPYRQPDPLPISAHLASRMWLGFASENGCPPLDLARAIYAARFSEGLDIRNPSVLRSVAEACGYAPERAEAYMYSDACRAKLSRNIDGAVNLGVPGIPCVVLGSELIFGVDRLPQLRWRIDRTPSNAP